MRNATPVNLRRAILRARRRGLSYVETAELLGVGEATVSRIVRLARVSRTLAPKPIRGGNYSPISGQVAGLLVELVNRMPDATVAELCSVLVERSGVSTSRAGVQRALHRLGFTRKKRSSWQRSATRPSTDATGARSAPSSSR